MKLKVFSSFLKSAIFENNRLTIEQKNVIENPFLKKIRHALLVVVKLFIPVHTFSIRTAEEFILNIFYILCIFR